jgi:hypothetical protein
MALSEMQFGKGIHRFPWHNFPDVWIHADEKEVRSHSDYQAAKTGDSQSAYRLVHAFLNLDIVHQIAEFAGSARITLASAHALERDGVNAIPEALSEALSEHFQCSVEDEIVQTNIVSHTKADGFSRLARQAAFTGRCEPGKPYFLVDDFVGQGGTLANLRGYIQNQGGIVIGATVLTGKSYSAKVSIEQDQIDELKNKHGEDLRKWWKHHFGFDYDCLTSSEAGYLIRTPCPQRIRDRIIAAFQKGDRSSYSKTEEN